MGEFLLNRFQKLGGGGQVLSPHILLTAAAQITPQLLFTFSKSFLSHVKTKEKPPNLPSVQ